jgi:hypothetical protein
VRKQFSWMMLDSQKCDYPLLLSLVGEAESCVSGPQKARMLFGVSQMTAEKEEHPDVQGSKETRKRPALYRKPQRVGGKGSQNLQWSAAR